MNKGIIFHRLRVGIVKEQLWSNVITMVLLAILTALILFQAYNIATAQSSIERESSNVLALSGDVGFSSSGRRVNLSLSSLGPADQEVPGMGFSYFYDNRSTYSFGSSVLPLTTNPGAGKSEISVSSTAICGQSLTMQMPLGWRSGMRGEPALIAQNVTQSNFPESKEDALIGPGVVSTIFGGVQSWPDGTGVLLPPNLNYLFGISAKGNGIVNATVVASSWKSGVGFVPIGHSHAFTMNTMSYQNLTVVPDGWGRFSTILNSTTILESSDSSYLPNVGPIGLWVSQNGSMNFEAIFARSGETLYSD